MQQPALGSTQFASRTGALQNERERIAIVYASDGNFLTHTFTSIYSLVVNNRDLALDIYVLIDSPSRQLAQDLQRLEALHDDVRFEIIVVDDDALRDAPINLRNYTVSTYYRLLIGRLLPESVTSVLYLDADTIVRGSLNELVSMDLGAAVVAAVPGLGEYSGKEHWRRLGLPENTIVFNPGVMLIDLDRWRSTDVEARASDYIATYQFDPVRLMYQDQDALNYVLRDEWHPLDLRFNFGEWMPTLEDYEKVKGRRGTSTRVNPTIVHYTGPVKPWHGGSLHPFESDYWFYRKQTHYANRRQLIRSKLLIPARYVRYQILRVLRALPFGEVPIEIARKATESVDLARRLLSGAGTRH